MCCNENDGEIFCETCSGVNYKGWDDKGIYVFCKCGIRYYKSINSLELGELKSNDKTSNF